MNKNKFSRYYRVDVVRSIYFYTDCDVLQNKLNIKSEELLQAVEEDITNQRISELEFRPLKGTLGLAHLLRIHEYIFQDIYYFAGEIRRENIWKDNTFFCKTIYIKENLQQLFNNLKQERNLAQLSVKDFAHRAAFYMSELNMIHPFREGNGRGIREYIRLLALKNGYYINWSLVDAQELLKATIISVDKNIEPLSRILYDSIEKK